MPQTFQRLQRCRQHPSLREMVRQTHLHAADFVQPLFIHHEANRKQAITSMPGQFQWGLARLPEVIEKVRAVGIRAVILFGIPAIKDRLGMDSYAENGLIQQAIQVIKHLAPDLAVITDNCLCEYTTAGHCCVLDESGKQFDYVATLELLAKQAISLARAGADMLAPSGMQDGMVHVMREALDSQGYKHLPIMSYSAKYCSSFYGPFREAAEGAPQFGDRRSYQMDPANSDEALRESAADLAEGADILMVKPASSYLDVIYRLKQAHPGVPIAAYHVSGEYAMLKAGAANGYFDEQLAFREALTSIKRAGADLIITYAALELLDC